MGRKQRLEAQILRLEEQLELVNDYWHQLRCAQLQENRADEIFRLDHLIAKKKCERQSIEQQLNNLESQLSKECSITDEISEDENEELGRETITAYQETLEENPFQPKPSVFWGIANAYFEKEDYKNALENYIQSYVADLQQDGFYDEHSEYEERFEHPKYAKESLNRIYEIGNIYYEIGDYNQAIQVYKQFCNADPYKTKSTIDKICEIGDNFFNAKDYRKAHEAYAEAVKLAHRYELAVYRLANFHRKKSQYKKAVSLYMIPIGGCDKVCQAFFS